MAFKTGDTVYVVDASKAPAYTGMSGVIVHSDYHEDFPYVVQTETGLIVCAEAELSADPAE